MKNQLKSKQIYNIQVFLGFANFYQQFIPNFSKTSILLILILKTIRLFNWLGFKKNDDEKSVYKRNNNNNKIVKFDIDNNIKFAKKFIKLKNQKLSKSLKLSKSRNLSKNNIIRRSSFLFFNF